MRVYLSLVAMIFIWSTVPLTAKWSIDGPHYFFGAISRILVGTVCALAWLVIAHRRLPMHRQALTSYAISSCNFIAWILMYWGVQFIPSGWMGITIGAMPLITAVLVAIWLGERSLTPLKLSGLLVGFSGILVVFATAFEVGIDSLLGISAVLVSMAIAAAVPVAMRRLNALAAPFDMVMGGLLLALPVYFVFWALSDFNWPADIPLRAGISALYIGSFGTVVIFTLFFYTLQHLSITQVALVGMITPISSLMLGILLNNEPMNLRIGIGAGLIVVALLLHEYLPRRLAAAQQIKM
jgi:drug/metabolite transporter (DMT)-like permease